MKTDRTNPNNNLDIIIHDNDKGTGMLIDTVISGDRDQEKCQEILKYKDLTMHVKYKNQSDTSNNRGTWNHQPKIIQKLTEQHTRNRQNQELQKTAILDTADIL